MQTGLIATKSALYILLKEQIDTEQKACQFAEYINSRVLSRIFRHCGVFLIYYILLLIRQTGILLKMWQTFMVRSKGLLVGRRRW